MSTLLKSALLLPLLAAPAMLAVYSGHPEFARYLSLGLVLSLQLCLLSRPLAPAALMLPFIYAAAAVTAAGSGGVAALIVAIAAGVGAGSSRGFHRGLVALLAAALIGSFEPAIGETAMARAAAMLVGCVYGFALSATVLARFEPGQRAASPQTAMSFSVLLSVLVLIAWIAARAAALPDGWWLPLAVAALGEPTLAGSSLRAAARLGCALLGVSVAVLLMSVLGDPLHRALATFAILLTVMYLGHARPSIQAFFLTPVVVLIGGHEIVGGPGADYIRTTLLACTLVFAVAVLGAWVLWILRPDSGRATA